LCEDGRRETEDGTDHRPKDLSAVDEEGENDVQVPGLRVYQMALDYQDEIYRLSAGLPDDERFNLVSQIRRAAVSIALNIAEGSTSQTDPEQHRFLGHALRSYLETVACMDIIERRGYLAREAMVSVQESGHSLFVALQAFRKRIGPTHV
jgi:four helix bundle protein